MDQWKNARYPAVAFRNQVMRLQAEYRAENFVPPGAVKKRPARSGIHELVPSARILASHPSHADCAGPGSGHGISSHWGGPAPVRRRQKAAFNTPKTAGGYRP